MLGHIGLNVPDLAVAKQYYDVLMPALGFTEYFNATDELAYWPAGAKPGTYIFFYPANDASDYKMNRTGLQHLAFMVPTRQAVSDAYELALSLGSVSLHSPQEFPQYPRPYFAAFWNDPFGFKIEAVCHYDR
ncbi:MAG: extradiol dioxygenase [Actinomycetota bacterium]|nr:extradiol dioxygenase [Actinomycetota bacterium]